MIQELVRNIREQYSDDFFLFLQFGDLRIQVSSNDRAVIEELNSYYTGFIAESDTYDIHIQAYQGQTPNFPFSYTQKEPDPGKHKIKEEYADIRGGRVVRKRLTGMTYIFGNGDHIAVGPCTENINQVINFINNRHIESVLSEGGLLGHAAGVIWKDRGLAMAGFSGAGKSTLSLHLMNRGATFVSNDRLIIKKNKNGIRMYGVAKMPRINPGTILNNPNLQVVMSEEDREKFSKLPESELWQLEHKYDADIETCFGPDRFLLESDMHALVILSWNKDSQTPIFREVNLAERTDLLHAFMKPVGLFFMPENQSRVAEPSEQNYIDMLSLCRILEISGGIDFDIAADRCLSFLESINP